MRKGSKLEERAKKELRKAGLIKGVKKPLWWYRIGISIGDLEKKLKKHGWMRIGKASARLRKQAFSKGFLKLEFWKFRADVVRKKGKRGSKKVTYTVRVSVDLKKHNPFLEFEKNLPSIPEIRKLSLARLNGLAGKVEKILEETNLRWRTFSDIRRYKKILALLKARNDKMLQAARRSPLWKKAVLKASSASSHWVPKKILKNPKKYLALDHVKLEKVPLDIDFKSAEKAFLHTLKQYENDISGYWTMIKVSSQGKIRQIGLFDRLDGEQHKNIFYSVLLKFGRRYGHAPKFSAAQIPVGTVLTGRDGRKYVVKKVGKSRRWVPKDK
jgi:DNA-binding Lrp family transcriptional regulator